MKELKKEAEELGLEFAGNISKVKLQEMIDEAKNQTAGGSTESVTEWRKDTVKVSITPRDSEEKEGFVGLNGYSAQFQFDVAIDLPKLVVDTLKTKGMYIHTRNDKGETVKKWQSRYLIEYL